MTFPDEPVPSPCRRVQSEIAALERDRRELHVRLRNAPTNEKSGIVVEMRRLGESITDAQNRLAQCIADSPQLPPPLLSTFTGSVALTIGHSVISRENQMAITLFAAFNGARTSVALVDFPVLTTPPCSTPFGETTTTVRKKSGGAGVLRNGNIQIPLTLRFDHSLDLWWYGEEDSDLELLLTTQPGCPVGPGGAVELTGSGTFRGGVLAGGRGDLSLAGTLAPPP